MTIQNNFPNIKPSLNLDFANTKSLDSRITFTRASTATFFDQFGVLKSAESDAARFDHDPITGESLGLLIEEQRTNLLTYSEQFDNAAWNKTNATITANTQVAPDGTTTADTITDDATLGTHHSSQTIAVTSGNSYTVSCFLKKGTARYARLALGGAAITFLSIIIDLDLGTTNFPSGSTITALNNGWYRVSATSTAASTGNGVFSVGITNSTGTSYSGVGDTLFIWGAQLEAGAFPSSYIKTEASQVTRAADSAVMTGTNFSSWYNATEGTLYTEARSNTVRGSDNAFPIVFSITDGTNNDTIRMFHRNLIGNDNGLFFGVRAGNVIQASLNLNSSNLTVGQFYKSAGVYKLNDFAGSMDAGSVVTDVSGTIPTVNAAYIGKEAGLLNPLNGHIKRLAYYPRRLANAQLQALTA